MMQTGVSGMQGHANKLSTVADNIANANTVGYKKFGIEFSTLVINGSRNDYNPGGITTSVRQMVTQQGVLQYTGSAFDLALDGNGFFVVQDQDGNAAMTRAGSFVPDENGNLVNSAGYFLSGYNFDNGDPAVVANGLAGLERVTVADAQLRAAPSDAGVLQANLPADAEIATAPFAAANAVGANYTQKTSMVAYDNLGGSRILDVYLTKTADETWEVSVYDQADASAGTSFPYASGPLTVETLTFDASDGQLNGPTALSIPVPGGQTLALDLTGTSQLAAEFQISSINIDGNAPAAIEQVSISADGTVYAQYTDDTLRALFRVPIADVVSPDQLTSVTGNVFMANERSGDVTLGFAGQGGNGSIVSGALESSNVDIAEELTEMIQSQRNYTANSKVFQTGSELMDVLLSLKR